jgi:protein archease
MLGVGNEAIVKGGGKQAMPPLRPASHEILQHTSEIRLRIRAGSLAELMAEAGRALARLQLHDAERTAAGSWRPIEVSAPDRAALLADWLNELVYLAETERWVAVDFGVDHADDRTLRARVRGVILDRAPALVKAATLHGLRIDDTPEGLEGEVMLDV